MSCTVGPWINSNSVFMKPQPNLGVTQWNSGAPHQQISLICPVAPEYAQFSSKARGHSLNCSVKQPQPHIVLFKVLDDEAPSRFQRDGLSRILKTDWPSCCQLIWWSRCQHLKFWISYRPMWILLSLKLARASNQTQSSRGGDYTFPWWCPQEAHIRNIILFLMYIRTRCWNPATQLQIYDWAQSGGYQLAQILRTPRFHILRPLLIPDF